MPIKAAARANAARGQSCPVCGVGPGQECLQVTDGDITSRLVAEYTLADDTHSLSTPMHVGRIHLIDSG